MEAMKDKYEELSAALKEQLTNHEAIAKHIQGAQARLVQARDAIIALQAQLGLLEDLDPSLKETGE